MRKRTVRCSHCYQTGHNKSSCPQWKAKIEEWRSAYGDDYYHVRKYDEKKAKKAAAAKTRKCSYCGGHGHNRAGCPKLKAAIAAYASRNAEYRANVLYTLSQSGLGPGSMVQYQDYWGDTKTSMVVRVLWDKINMSAPGASILEVADVQKLASGTRDTLALSTSITGRTYGSDYAVVVEVEGSKIQSLAPAAFLDGSLGVKALFKDKKQAFHTMRDSWGDFDNEFDPTIHRTTVKAD